MSKYIPLLLLLFMTGGCAAFPTLDYQYEQNLVQLRAELDQDVKDGKLNKYEAEKIYLEQEEYYARDIDRRNAKVRSNSRTRCHTSFVADNAYTTCW